MNLKHLSFWALTCSCFSLIGCGPSHRAVPLLEAGMPLHLVVDVPSEQAPGALGTIYYSLPQNFGTYVEKPMDLQGNVLVTTLPTRDLVPGDRVLY